MNGQRVLRVVPGACVGYLFAQPCAGAEHVQVATGGRRIGGRVGTAVSIGGGPAVVVERDTLRIQTGSRSFVGSEAGCGVGRQALHALGTGGEGIQHGGQHRTAHAPVIHGLGRGLQALCVDVLRGLAVAPAPFAVAAAHLGVQLPAECLGHVLEGLTSLPASRHFPDITQGLELGVFRLELGAGGELVGAVAGLREDRCLGRGGWIGAFPFMLPFVQVVDFVGLNRRDRLGDQSLPGGGGGGVLILISA